MFQSQYEARFSNEIAKLCKQIDKAQPLLAHNKLDDVQQYKQLVTELHRHIYEACFRLDSFQQFVRRQVNSVECPEFQLNLQVLRDHQDQSKKIQEMKLVIEQKDSQIANQLQHLQNQEKEAKEKLNAAANERQALIHEIQDLKNQVQLKEKVERQTNQQIAQQQETISKLNTQMASYFQKYKEDLSTVDALNTQRLLKINNENIRQLAVKQEQYDKLNVEYFRSREQMIQLQNQNEQVCAKYFLDAQNNENVRRQLKQNYQNKQSELQKVIDRQSEEARELKLQIARLDKELQAKEEFDKKAARQNLYNEATLTVQVYINELKEELQSQKALASQLVRQNRKLRAQIEAQQLKIKELGGQIHDRYVFEEASGKAQVEQLLKIKHELERENADLRRKLMKAPGLNGAASPTMPPVPRDEALERQIARIQLGKARKIERLQTAHKEKEARIYARQVGGARGASPGLQLLQCQARVAAAQSCKKATEKPCSAGSTKIW